jgi:hypothetical protein
LREHTHFAARGGDHSVGALVDDRGAGLGGCGEGAGDLVALAFEHPVELARMRGEPGRGGTALEPGGGGLAEQGAGVAVEDQGEIGVERCLEQAFRPAIAAKAGADHHGADAGLGEEVRQFVAIGDTVAHQGVGAAGAAVGTGENRIACTTCHGGMRSQARGAGHVALDHYDQAAAVFMGTGTGRFQLRTGDAAPVALYRDADVREQDLAATLDAGIEDMGGLEGGERQCSTYPLGRAEIGAAVGRKPGGQIDREAEARGGDQFGEDRADAALERAGQAGAEQAVDQHGTRAGLVERGDLPAPALQHRAARRRAGLATGGDRDVMAGCLQQAGGDIGVSAIVAGTGEDEDRIAHARNAPPRAPRQRRRVPSRPTGARAGTPPLRRRASGQR